MHRMEQRVLGGYRLIEQIGKGSTCVIFKAENMKTKEEAAIKILSVRLNRDPVIRERFRLEAEAMSLIDSPHVVRILELGCADTATYIVMELVRGMDLGRLVEQQGPLLERQAVSYTLQTAIGLMAAFEQGVIHRDIKPSNLLLEVETDHVRITDFGIAKGAFRRSDLTHKGTVVGTPNYLSPEQARGREVDFRSDIYSLGATLFFLLAGHPPYRQASAPSVLQAHLRAPVPTVDGVSDELASVLSTMMAKDPADRFGSYEELGTGLGDVLTRM